jgi:hypothetical protein
VEIGLQGSSGGLPFNSHGISDLTIVSCDPLRLEADVVLGDPGGGTCYGATVHVVVTDAPCGGGSSRAALGSVQGTTGTTLTLAGKTVEAGALLVVSTWCSPAVFTGVTFNGTPLHKANAGGSTGAEIWFLSVGADTTGDIVATTGSTIDLAFLAAVEVTGLAFNTLDKVGAGTSGSSSAPDTGATGTTSLAVEYVQAAFYIQKTAATWSWNSPFSSGGQDQAHDPYYFTEGYRVTSSTGTQDAALGSLTADQWEGVIATFI